MPAGSAAGAATTAPLPDVAAPAAAAPEAPDPKPAPHVAERRGPTPAPTEAPMVATVWCAKCEEHVVPRAKGLCPHCGRFLPGSYVSKKHPISLKARASYVAELQQQYPFATTPTTRKDLDLLASVYERLDVLKVGSQEHKNALAAKADLVAALEAACPPQRPSTTTSVAPTPAAMIALSDALRASAGIVERAPEFAAHHDGVEVFSTRDALPELPAPEPRRPVIVRPTTPCEFCRLMPEQCQEVREQNLDEWRLSHWDDPAEQQRRAEAATAEMFESLRRQRGSS